MADRIDKVFAAALDELSLLKYFPSDPGSRAALLRILCQMVAGPVELRWLVDTVLKYYDEWPGPRELRAVYCTRHRPKDGIEAGVSSQRFLTELEQRAIEAQPLKTLPMAPEPRRLIAGIVKRMPS